MATIENKINALSKLMQDGILTGTEFASIVSLLNGNYTPNAQANPVQREKTDLEKRYDEVFSKHIINVFKSPASCKWPELKPDMIKEGVLKIDGKPINCRYIETYIDAPNSYGALLRKQLRLVLGDNGMIIRALEPLQTSGVTLLGMIANAATKDCWTDIVKLV